MSTYSNDSDVKQIPDAVEVDEAVLLDLHCLLDDVVQDEADIDSLELRDVQSHCWKWNFIVHTSQAITK